MFAMKQGQGNRKMDCSLSHAHTRTCTYAHTRNYIIYWRRRGAGEERSILKNRQIMFPSVLPSSPSAWCPNLLQLTRSATKQDTIAQSHPKSINTQGHNPPNSPDGGSHVQVRPEMFDWAWVSGSRTFTELSQRSPVLWKVHMRVFFSRHFMRRVVRLSHKDQMGDLLDPSHFYLHDLWSSVRMTIWVLDSWLHLFFIFGFDRQLWEEFWLFQSSSSSWRWCRELTLTY